MEIIRIPILKIEDFLIASIQTALHDVQAMDFKDSLLQRIYETKSKGVILDLTAIDVLDSFVGRLINDISQMSNLMGAKVVITGLQPAVAMRAWSIAPKPRARAVSRATMRAATMSRSLLIMITLGSAIGSMLRNTT